MKIYVVKFPELDEEWRVQAWRADVALRRAIRHLPESKILKLKKISIEIDKN